MAFKQYTCKSQSYADSLIPDTVLDSEDPIHRIKQLAGLPTSFTLNELVEYNNKNLPPAEEGSNISYTASEKAQYQIQHNIKPGTPEWFKLWFSLPYMTGEKPW